MTDKIIEILKSKSRAAGGDTDGNIYYSDLPIQYFEEVATRIDSLYSGGVSENNHKMVDFVDSLAPIAEYVDGDKIAHRFHGLTIPVIEFNEMRDRAKKWKSHPTPEISEEETICCGTCIDMNDGECMCEIPCIDFSEHCHISKGVKPVSEEEIEKEANLLGQREHPENSNNRKWLRRGFRLGSKWAINKLNK